MSLSPTMLHRLARVLVVCTWGLIVFGASVRVHGAGLACPDWPLCFGQVIPPIDFQVSLEFGHRVVAGLISLAFLVLGGGVLLRRAELGREMPWLVVAAAATLVLQVVLGGLTVLELLAEWTVTSHLLAGNTFCMWLLLIALGLRDAVSPRERAPVGWGVRAVAVGLGLSVPLQLGLGGLVASSYAGLACGTWPTCDGTNWFPTFEGLVGLQLTHRLMAYLVVTLAGVAAFVVRGAGAGPARAVFVISLAQAAVGVANVLLRMPVEVTLLHSAGAAATWLATAWLNWEVWRAPAVEATPRPQRDESVRSSSVPVEAR